MLLFVLSTLLPLTAAQYPCTTCQTNINAQYDTRSHQRQTGLYGSFQLNNEPGYLPDYQGDKYTNPQRIKDTQTLNAPFFESIGGAPPAPALTPAQQGISKSIFPYSSPYQASNQLHHNYQKTL